MWEISEDGDIKFLYIMKVMPRPQKDIGSIVHLGTIHYRYHSKQRYYSLKEPALFIDKHVFVYDFVLSLYTHLRAHTNFLEMYGK